MKKFIFIIIFIGLSSTVQAENLDKWDKILFTSFIAGQVIDGFQTIEVIENPNYYELNPGYDSVGSDWVIPIKIIETGVLYYIVKKVKPKYKKPILIGCNVIVWGLVTHNFKIGVKF